MQVYVSGLVEQGRFKRMVCTCGFDASLCQWIGGAATLCKYGVHAWTLLHIMSCMTSMCVYVVSMDVMHRVSVIVTTNGLHS